MKNILKRLWILFLIALILSAGSALAGTKKSGDMNMKRWSYADVEPKEIYKYYMNFGAVDKTTGNLIESNQFSLHLWNTGLMSSLGSEVNRFESYSTSSGRGVFSKLGWQPGKNLYHIQVTRTPANYRIPSGSGTFDIKQDYGNLPSWVKLLAKIGEAAFSKIVPGGSALVKAADFLLKTGMPTDITCSGDFSATMNTTQADWKTPWYCYKWIEVKLEKKYAQSVSVVVPEYNPEKAETIPHLYDASGKEYPLAENGTYAIKTTSSSGKLRNYPMFTSTGHLPVGDYTLSYKGKTYEFTINGVGMPRLADGTCDIAAYNSELTEQDKRIAQKYGFDKYYASANQFVPLDDNDWTKVQTNNVGLSVAGDGTEVKNHVLIVGIRYEDEVYRMDPATEYVVLNVQYDSQPYAASEKIRFYSYTPYSGRETYYKYLNYELDLPLTDGKGSITFDKNDTTGVFNLLKDHTSSGLEPVDADCPWKIEYSQTVDVQKNIVTHFYTLRMTPAAPKRSVTIYPVDENNNNISKYYVSTADTQTDEPVVFTLTKEGGLEQWIHPDGGDRVQYTLSLEANKTYTLKIIYSVTDFYRTDSCWTIVTNADGSIQSFTPSEKTVTTGPAEKKDDGLYSVMLLYKNPVEITFQKEWVDALGNQVSSDEEPADAVYITVKSKKTRTENHIVLRKDRNWQDTLLFCAVDSPEIIVEKVLKGSEEIFSAEGWDNLYSPKLGLQYPGKSASYVSTLPYFEEGTFCTVYLRNVKEAFSFYKTNGISFVQGYSFKLNVNGTLFAVDEQNTTIDGAPATKYTLHLNKLTGLEAGTTYHLKEYLNGSEIGYWNFTQGYNGIVTLDGLYYGNAYQTLKADGSRFRKGITLGTETMNLMDNGVRRGYDTYTVSLQKDWSEDIADLPESVEVELIPIGTGTTLSEKLGKLADIGTSAGIQTVKLTAANGWHADVTLRSGVVYWVYEKDVTFKDENQTAKFAASYYIESRTAGKPRTESWTAAYVTDGEEEDVLTFGNGEDAICGALLCNDNESAGVRDTLHIANSSDDYHTFQVDININIPDGVSAVKPRHFTVVLEEYDAKAGTWTVKETTSVSATESTTVYFSNLSAEKNYYARLRYDDEDYGIIEEDTVVGVSVTDGRICPKEQVSIYKQATPYYSLSYDDSRNVTDNIQTITLTPAGNIRVYTTVMYGGTKVSELTYEMVRFDVSGNETVDSAGTLTHINSDTPDYVTISEYNPASYTYDLKLTDSFYEDETLYVSAKNGHIYRVEKMQSIETGTIYIYLYEQRRITLFKNWITDAEELDRPDSVTLALQKKVKTVRGRITSYTWEDCGKYVLSEENNWTTCFYTDLYVKENLTTVTPEYRVRELDAENKAVEEDALVLYQIPERTKGETIIPAHSTLFCVNYSVSEDNNTMTVTNTAVMEETLKKIWQIPSSMEKMNMVVLGLYAKAEGSADDPGLARNVYTKTITIDGKTYPFAIVNSSGNWKVTFLANKYNASGTLLEYSGGELGLSALPAELTAEAVLAKFGLTEAERETYLNNIQKFQSVSGTAYNAYSNISKVIPVVNIPKTTPGEDQILVYKIWDDEIDHSADSVTVRLYSSEKLLVETAVLNAGNEWKHTFTNLPGNMSDYSISEEVPTGYYAEYGSFVGGTVRTIINHPKGEAGVVVNKDWDDSIIIKPESVEFTVVQYLWNEAGTEKSETGVKYALELKKENSWTASIGSLPLHDNNGNLYDYTVLETKVDGKEELARCFDCAYVEDKIQDGNNVLYVFACTNLSSTAEGDQLTIHVEKTWDDGSGVYQEPITLNLKAGGETVKTFTLSKDDTADGKDWSKTFTVPKYDYTGAVISYDLDEVKLEGYESKITRTETDENNLSFKIENKSTSMHVILRYIGDGDTSIRPSSATVRLQKKVGNTWEDVKNGDAYVEKALPEATEEQDDAQKNQFTAVFTDLTPGTDYRVRLCHKSGESLIVLPDGVDKVNVKDKTLVPYQEENSSAGYQVVYSEVKNNDTYSVQIITLNKLLRVEVQWLDNSNAAKTRPDSLPLTFKKTDSKSENQVDTGYTDEVKGWKDDAGTGTFIMSEEHGFDAGTIGTARVTGEEKDDDRILWHAPNGSWYLVKYEESDDPYLVKIILREQLKYAAKKKWDIDILGNDKPKEIEVRLETWEGEKGGDDNKDEPDGTEVETITLSADGTEESSSWEGSFKPVDRYKITYEEDGKTIKSQTEINYRVREVYNERILTKETGRKLVAKPGTDVTFHVEAYNHPDGSEEKEHDTLYMVKYETEDTTTTITNAAVLDTTITKFWVMLGHAEKPDSVYLVLLSRYKEAYREIIEQIPAIGGFVSAYTPMVSVSGDSVSILGKKLPVTIAKANEENNWTVNFRVKKYGQFGIPMDFKGAELVSGIEQSLASWLLKLNLPVGFNPLKKFVSFNSPLFMITDSWGISLVANVWGSVDPDPGSDPNHKVICGIKYWNDSNSSTRPASITIKIKNASTGKVAKTLTVTAKDNWVWSWDQAEKAVSYIVEEEVPDGYTVRYSEMTIGSKERWIIINSKSSDSEGCTEHFVKKYWRDNLDHSANTVHVRLYQNDTEIASADLTAENNWSYTFKNLDKSYTYSVKEDAVPGYNTTYSRSTSRTYIYNTPPDTTAVKLIVKKVWNNVSEAEIPDTLAMDVLRDGVVVNTVVLEKDKGWTAEVTTDKDGAALRKQSDAGRTYDYTISEPEVPAGCTFSVSKQTANSGTVIKLTGTNSYSSVAMAKITICKEWNEQPALEHDPVQVLVKANNETVDTVVLGKSNKWSTVRFFNQNDENGNPIVYTIEELPVDGYTDSYAFDETNNKLTVINTPWAEAGSTILVTNHVDTENDGSPDRAFHFSFNLKNALGEQLSNAQIILQKTTGTELGTIELGTDGFSFQLKDGEQLLILNVSEGSIYKVTENPTADEQKAYDSEVVINSQDTPLLATAASPTATQTAQTEIVAAGTKRKQLDEIDFYQSLATEDLQVTKIWENGSTDSVSFVLYRNGQKFNEYPSPIRSGNIYTFEKLNSYSDTGSEIYRNVWSVTEKSVEGFWTIYSNVDEHSGETDRLYNGGTVYNRPYTTFHFTKIWKGTSPRTITLEATNQDGETYTRKVKTDSAKGTYTIALPKYAGSEPAIYTVKEIKDKDLTVTYLNEGEYAEVKDCIYDGGTITNIRVPRTADTFNPYLYACGALTALGLLIVLTVKKRKEKHN